MIPQKRRLLPDLEKQQQKLQRFTPPQPHSPQLRPQRYPGSRSLQPLQPQPLVGSTAKLSVRQIAIHHFRNETGIKDAKQLDRLVKASIGFIEKVKLDATKYDIWSKKAEIFDERESKTLSRVCRLFKGRQRLSGNRMLYACADRLSLVFIHHEISERMRTINQVLPRHQKRMTVACNDIARELDITPMSLKNHRDGGRCYVELLLQAGPGDLLALGPGQSTLYGFLYPNCSLSDNVHFLTTWVAGKGLCN